MNKFDAVSTVFRIPARLAQTGILLYQRTISLDHGPLSRIYHKRVCRFWPTCSEFGYVAIGRFGLWRGSWLTLKRLSRCHPWQNGGLDPVPGLCTDKDENP